MSWKLLIVCVILCEYGLYATAQTDEQPTSPLIASYENYRSLRDSTPYRLKWTNISPVVNSARVEAVQLDPTRPGTIFAAFGSGGLWKSVNGGLSWRSMLDDAASYGIGDIALAPSNPDVIYLGTGESLKKARNFTIPGTGVYRSDDGGESWRNLGLDDAWQISEIAVHPTNPDIALVAVLGHFWTTNIHRGLYRTENGGKTWQHVLFLDDRTGANDVVWGKDNTDIVYASMWQNFPDVSGGTSGVFRSRDAGVTWEKCDGLPSGDLIGRIGLAVSQSDARKAYALIDDRSRIQSGAAQIYRTEDGGSTWQRTHTDDLHFLSRIGWYFADIYVNPQDDNEIFALGVRVAHSRDGGKTFELLAGTVTHVTPSAASGLHLDHCEMWIDPDHPTHLVLGNDGGLYESRDSGNTWLHFNNLPTGEFYDVEIDQGPDYRIFAGAQDNATVVGRPTASGPFRTEPWRYLWIDPWNGGDGCVTRVDSADPNTVYYSAQEGAFQRMDMTTGRSNSIRPQLVDEKDVELKFNFVAPMIISTHAPGTLFLGGNFLFESTDRGDHWNRCPKDFASDAAPDRITTGLTAIAESPTHSGRLWVGTDQGEVWFRSEPDSPWIHAGELPRGYIRSIVASQHSDSRVYVTLSGLNFDHLDSWVFCSDDHGKSWRSISANVFDEPVNVIAEDPTDEDILYMGTFRGIYVTCNRGDTWQCLGQGLPACSVADIEIHRESNDMIVATHGRGIFQLNLQPLQQAIRESFEDRDESYLFEVPDGQLPYLNDVRPGKNFRSFPGIAITCWLSGPGPVKLTVLNDQKVKIAELKFEGASGLNQFQWNMCLKETESPQPYFINYRDYISAGSYTVQLDTGDGHPISQPLRVIEP